MGNGQWVSLIPNFLLIVVTGVYAYLTYCILREMRRTRERQFIPFVSIKMEAALADYRGEFIFRNEGNSVAINLIVDLVHPKFKIGPENYLPGGLVELGRRGALSQGDSFTKTVDLTTSDRKYYIMRALYLNIYGQLFEVRQPYQRKMPMGYDPTPERVLDTEFWVDGKRIEYPGKEFPRKEIMEVRYDETGPETAQE